MQSTRITLEGAKYSLTVGALLAFAAAPLALGPAAHADDFGLGDVIGDLIAGASAGTADGPGAALEVGVQGVDHALAAVSSDPLTGLSLDAWFQQFVYEPIHTAIDDWINSPLGMQVDGFINQFAPQGSIFIGNGADGTSAADPDGQSVLWFGDGGDGWNSTEAGTAGGDGGAGGIFGNGGSGGDGGAGAAGGDGGDGGWLLGNGGAGGDAGDGGAGLPALGGAGGVGGIFGEHGVVGHYGTADSGPPTGASDLTSADGWLTDSDGRVVLLHGLNSIYKIAPYTPSAGGFSDDDAQFLADNGFNAVRLGIIWAGVEPQPGVFDNAYLASIEQTVQTLADHNIRVILDMHQDTYGSVFGGEGAPEWATQTGGLPNPQLGFPFTQFVNPAEQHAWGAFWSNAQASDGVGLQNHYAQAWEYVAHHFKDNPDVVGYELMNEPYAQGTVHGLVGNFGTADLTPFYNQVDSAIRAVDPNTPVFFEPNADTNLGTPIGLGTVNDPNSVLAFHAYCYVQLGPLGCFPNVDQAVGNAAEYAQAHGIPAFMTEFGASSNQALIAASLDPANQQLLGWTEWNYTGKGDISTFTAPNDEALVYDPALPPTGDNVNTATLATLAEPYPQVVAGTPSAWSFENGVFQFSYSTDKVDGVGSFAAGSQTTISVPKVEFPGGYDVNVTGGHVVSDANAPLLVIASDGSATTVTVTVSAASG